VAQVVIELLLPRMAGGDEAAVGQLFQQLIKLVGAEFPSAGEVLHHVIPRGDYGAVADDNAQLGGQSQFSQPNARAVFQAIDVVVVIAVEIDVARIPGHAAGVGVGQDVRRLHQSKGFLKISAGYLDGFLHASAAGEHLHQHLALAQFDDFFEKNLIPRLLYRSGIGSEGAGAGVEGVSGPEIDDKADDDHDNDHDPHRLGVFT